MATSSSYQFIPRKLIKRKPNVSHDPNLPTAKPHGPPILLPVADAAKIDSQSQQKLPDEHIAIWVNLAMSHYAVWSDPDLRRVLDSGDQEPEPNYIPLRFLLRNSPVLASADELEHVSEAQVVKALRAHSPTVFDIRVLISEPTKTAWSTGYNAKGKEREDMGGYEIRRLNGGKLGSLTREDWKARTVYFERIPTIYRTIPAIAQFILSLLSLLAPSPESEPHESTRIQSITLPPHHFDKQGSTPKFKGFAFVVFSALEDANRLLTRWPWEGHWSSGSNEEKQDLHLDTGASTTEGEARRFGLRALSQTRWDELKEEYLSYRKTLIERVSDDGAAPNIPPTVAPPAPTVLASVPPSDSADGTPTIIPPPAPPGNTPVTLPCPHPSLDDPYPYGCLVFVRNIHPATNKTTLRALFSSVFEDKEDKDAREAIDYVDFNKGMDSCYLRLSTPASAAFLSSHFSTHPTVQAHGLDEAGSQGDSKSIEVEVVRGKREAVYWEKVPEKVRRGAVAKAIGSMNNKSESKDEEEGRQRKRKKRG
ncbi:hypothetical protein PLEOSDRAFT_1103792 [Pleurotus ostreatus PC15]|uniref:XRRM domain-containing protein n=2 Tax=Pleurotus TaxID=5320 RepID=A0A067NRY5_PLEO1|nr:hypothetical protein CCMSSC00406_0001303 [Pleurotus cornucopiae]KDQ29780.1 hypothetical protein PLEOSDRAFT_1103792 [Pleurotus ostreatus PC15]